MQVCGWLSGVGNAVFTHLPMEGFFVCFDCKGEEYSTIQSIIQNPLPITSQLEPLGNRRHRTEASTVLVQVHEDQHLPDL